jgi:hypothetical protein
LNIYDLKAVYEQTIGHSTSNSTIYNLLARHGLAQADAAPVSSESRHRGSKRFKKRLSKCCEASPAGGRQTWLQLAHHVRRRRLYEPSATMLGSPRNETSRIASILHVAARSTSG